MQEVPYNELAEVNVLGSVLINPDCIVTLSLKPEDFFNEAHQYIYQAMMNLMKNTIEPNQITVGHELQRMGELDSVGGVSYLSLLVANCATSVSVAHYAKVVKDCAINRRLISLASQIQSIGYANSEPSEALEKTNDLIRNLERAVDTDKIITPNRLATIGMERYATLSHGVLTALKTGIPTLDYETGGLFQGEMWILGGRAGHGKTSLALQISQNMQGQGNILFASLEMDWRGLLDRMVASELGVHPRSVRMGNYSDEFYERIFNTIPKVAETNLYFLGKGVHFSGGVTTDMLFRIAREMQNSIGLAGIVVDYLSMLSDYGKTPYERITTISANLKRIFTTLEIPGLVLSQLSRHVERQSDKRPNLNDLRESGHVEEDADVVVLMYRPDKYRDVVAENPECRGTAELYIAKNRQGDSDITIPLRWDENKRIYQ